MNWTKLKNPAKALLIVVVIGLCVWAILPIQQKIKLGLDLQGGVRVLLQIKTSKEVPTITPQIQAQAIDVIDRRVNGMGVSEPVITKVGNDRILVELAGVKNPDEAVQQLVGIAVLEFKIVPENVRNHAEADKGYANSGKTDVNSQAYKDSGPTIYTGSELKGAQASFGQSGRPQILFQTKDPTKFGTLTKNNIGKALGIFLDGQYISAPTIQSTIADSGEITGQFTEDQVIAIANNLNSGALPARVTIIENDTVGALLGKLDLEKSLYASMIGLALVLVFMAFMYRLPGMLANLALIIYVLMMLALLAANHAVLTLPGIAGFVLSIGMAVDANVLIFERLKEEIWAGRTLRAAVRIGFSRAFSSVFDSHFTTIVGAGVLYMLGTGTVKGFAYTLFWGTVFSLITAVFITRFFTDVVVDNDLVTSRKAYGA